MGEQLKYIQIAGMVVPLLIVAVGMASWIFSLRADIDVVINEVAEISLDTARVNATSDEAAQELVERIGELEEVQADLETALDTCRDMSEILEGLTNGMGDADDAIAKAEDLAL